MGVFGKRAPSHLIPVSPDSAASNDWVVLLEAGTIVGPSPDRLRVAKSRGFIAYAMTVASLAARVASLAALSDSSSRRRALVHRRAWLRQGASH
jgi:hypothetical protein